MSQRTGFGLFALGMVSVSVVSIYNLFHPGGGRGKPWETSRFVAVFVSVIGLILVVVGVVLILTG
jgi:hypothetical protein